jgi:hypothetical protein
MANPVTVTCPGDAWTLVASSVKMGNVYISRLGPRYVITYVDAGGAAPVGTIDEEYPFDEKKAEIRSSVPIDVYVKPLADSSDNGEVLVML